MAKPEGEWTRGRSTVTEALPTTADQAVDVALATIASCRPMAGPEAGPQSDFLQHMAHLA